MSAPLFSKPDGPDTPPPRRIKPWRKFIGSMVPNWLQRRTEISQGAKLAYARLAQYAGKDDKCFPKQTTLAAELGVSERTANEYIRTLVKSGLIENERPGLGLSNRYFFLDHPWINEGQPAAQPGSGQNQQNSSAPDRQNSSDPEPQETSVPSIEEIQERESTRKENTHANAPDGFPGSLDEAVAIARQLGIDDAFARQEYHSKKAIGWKDGYGNQIISWPDHLLARWPGELRKVTERRSAGASAAKRGPSPARQFNPGDYNQPVKDF